MFWPSGIANFSHHVKGAALLRGELFIRLREGLDRLGGRSAVPIVAAVYAVDVDRALRLQLEDVLALPAFRR